MPTQSDPFAEESVVTPLSLYDALMGQIEPDLTTDALEDFEDLYDGETAEETQSRGERYRWAFSQFFALWDTFIAALRGDLQQYKSIVFDALKGRSQIEERDALHSLDEEISDTTDVR